MSYQVTLLPGGQQFTAEDDQTLLEAALQAGLLLPYSCRDGACGVCRTRLLDGDVRLDPYSPQALDTAQQAAGMTLTCRAHACSDIRLEVPHVSRADDIPVKKLPGRVQSMDLLAPDIMRLNLRLPATEPFQFRAGQYIDFLISGNRRRSFSIANAPGTGSELELHIRKVPGGEFTTHVFEGMKPREILRFEGPLGSFYLRSGSQSPVILLAGGTGFAPIKGIVEEAIAKGSQRPMTLYWGAHNRAGLYLNDLAQSWEQQLPGFRYVPVLSAAPAADAWQGRTGLVHEAVMADHPDLSGHEVYACGSPAMVDAAQRDFSQRCALPESAFFADSFTFSADTTPQT